MEIITRKVLQYHGNCQPQGPTRLWKLSEGRLGEGSHVRGPGALLRFLVRVNTLLIRASTLSSTR